MLANCTACQGLVRVPATAKPNQHVSCPHCSGSFALVQVLDQQVPEVQFLNGEAPKVDADAFSGVQVDSTNTSEPVNEAPVIEPGSKFQVPPQLAKGVRKRRRRRRSSSSRSEASRGTEAAENIKSRREERRLEEAKKQAEALSIAKPEPVREVVSEPAASIAAPVPAASVAGVSSPQSPQSAQPRRPSQRKTGDSAAAEWIKILLGGALAIPIAYLLLLWGFGRDPLSLAPSINRIVPALVPDYMVASESESTDGVESDQETPVSNSERLAIPETDPDDIGDVPDSVF